MKTEKIMVKDLKFDEKLLQLRRVNTFFVSRYRQHYRSGADMPLIIIDGKTRLIVSGNHRAQAMQSEYPDDKKIEVVIKTYKNRKDLLSEFAIENASHGNALDGISKRKIAIELIEAGATADEVARIFNISERAVELWGNQTATVRVGKKTTKTVPIKRGPEMSEPITSEQYEEHMNMDRGTSFFRDGNQILRWLLNRWVPMTPENLKLAKELRTVLDGFLSFYEKQSKNAKEA